MGIKLSDIKSEIKKSGSSKGKFLFFKEGVKVRVRFLTDMEDGMEIPFHDSYALGVNVPCQEMFGRECSYCENEDLRTRNMYAWSVYDYESKEVKILMAASNNCSPVPTLVALYEDYGTLLDRDYVIKQVGSQQNKSFSVIPQDKSKFRGGKKALSEQAILKYIDKAYPADNNDLDDDEDEEEERPRKNKGGNKTNSKPKKKEPEPEEEEWEEDEEEQETDYSEMSAKELYKLCKERDLDCKPKKAKEYYIDILEEADESDSDDWDEEEDEEEDW